MVEIGTDIAVASELLNSGQVIGFPTETVYGLAGNAFNEKAILEIFKVKNRPKFDPLIVHTHSLEEVDRLVSEIPEKASILAKSFWPGPLTLLLNKQLSIPDLVTSGLDTVAIRIPNHPLALALLRSLSFPLAAPSANPFGYVSPTNALHVANQLGSKIPYILDGGACNVGLESTIIGFEGEEPIIYRLGGKKKEDIEQLIGPVKVLLNKSSNPVAPGMLKSHYAPRKSVLIGDIEKMVLANKNKQIGIISFKNDYQYLNPTKQIILSPEGATDEAAKHIFASLRAMDEAIDCEIIVAELLPEKGLGRAINDRLDRASIRY